MLYWQDTSFDIKDAHPSMAILPIAAIQQHGSHLPVGVDLLLMDAIARRVAESIGEGVYLLPTMPLGNSSNQGGAPGTVWLAPFTLMHVVRDVVEALIAQGIRQVAVINQHGIPSGTSVVPQENFVVKTAVRQLNYEHPELRAIWVQPFTAAKEELAGLFPTASDEVHAGAVETSILLHLEPELVKGQGTDYLPSLSREYQDYLPFEAISAPGVWGNPSQATAALGEDALAACVQGTVRYIRESFAHLAKMRS